MDYDGINALHRAKKLSIIKMLIEIGNANPNTYDQNGLYLIHNVVAGSYFDNRYVLYGKYTIATNDCNMFKLLKL